MLMVRAANTRVVASPSVMLHRHSMHISNMTDLPVFVSSHQVRGEQLHRQRLHLLPHHR